MFWIYPQILEDVIAREDVSNEFSEVIGSKIQEVCYATAFSARLIFNNDKPVMFCNDYLMSINKDRTSRYKIIENKERVNLEKGLKVKNVYLRTGTSYAERVREYRINECFFQLESGEFVHVYPQDSKIGFEEYDEEMCQKLSKRIAVDDLYISEIEISDGDCKWIELKNNEKYIYVVSEQYFGRAYEMKILFSGKKINELDHIWKIEKELEPMGYEYVKLNPMK